MALLALAQAKAAAAAKPTKMEVDDEESSDEESSDDDDEPAPAQVRLLTPQYLLVLVLSALRVGSFLRLHRPYLHCSVLRFQRMQPTQSAVLSVCVGAGIVPLHASSWLMCTLGTRALAGCKSACDGKR